MAVVKIINRTPFYVTGDVRLGDDRLLQLGTFFAAFRNLPSGSYLLLKRTDFKNSGNMPLTKEDLTSFKALIPKAKLRATYLFYSTLEEYNRVTRARRLVINLVSPRLTVQIASLGTNIDIALA
jgi:hypothetical protein